MRLFPLLILLVPLLVVLSLFRKFFIVARKPFLDHPGPLFGPPQGADLQRGRGGRSWGTPPDSFPEWADLNKDCRAVAMLAIAVSSYFVCFGAALLIARGDLTTAIPVALPVGFVLAIAGNFVWEAPCLIRIRTYAEARLRARGVPGNVLDPGSFVEVFVQPRSGKGGREGGALGFLRLADSSLILQTTAGDVSISRASVQAFGTARIRGDTLSLFGARAVRLWWRSEGEPGTLSLCLISRDGETAFAIRRSTEALHERLVGWLPGHLARMEDLEPAGARESGPISLADILRLDPGGRSTANEEGLLPPPLARPSAPPRAAPGSRPAASAALPRSLRIVRRCALLLIVLPVLALDMFLITLSVRAVHHRPSPVSEVPGRLRVPHSPPRRDWVEATVLFEKDAQPREEKIGLFPTARVRDGREVTVLVRAGQVYVPELFPEERLYVCVRMTQALAGLAVVASGLLVGLVTVVYRRVGGVVGRPVPALAPEDAPETATTERSLPAKFIGVIAWIVVVFAWVVFAFGVFAGVVGRLPAYVGGILWILTPLVAGAAWSGLVSSKASQPGRLRLDSAMAISTVCFIALWMLCQSMIRALCRRDLPTWAIVDPVCAVTGLVVLAILGSWVRCVARLDQGHSSASTSLRPPTS